MLKKINLLLISFFIIVFSSGCSELTTISEEWNSRKNEFDYESYKLSLSVPSDSDQITFGAVMSFCSKASELSDGKIQINIDICDNPFEKITNNETDIALIRDLDIIRKEPKLNFVNMPFLFDSMEEYLSFISHENDKFGLSKYISNKYNIEQIGVYINSFAYMLNRNHFVNGAIFYTSIAVLENETYPVAYGTLGLRDVLVGKQDELYVAFNEKRAKYCEINTHSIVSDEALETASSIGLTEHKYYSDIMYCNKKSELPSYVILTLREAFAYTIESQNRLRLDEKEQFVASLTERNDMKIYTYDFFKKGRQEAKLSYQKYYKDLMIDENIWDELYEAYIKS